MALVLVVRLLLLSLAVLRIGEHVGAAARGRSLLIGAGRIGIAVIRGRRPGHRRGIRYHVAVLPGVPGVVDVIAVVVRDSAPVIGRVRHRQGCQEQREPPSIIGTRPERAVPVATSPKVTVARASISSPEPAWADVGGVGAVARSGRITAMVGTIADISVRSETVR